VAARGKTDDWWTLLLRVRTFYESQGP